MQGFYKVNSGGEEGCDYLVYRRNLETGIYKQLVVIHGNCRCNWKYHSL
jgi:tRNA splicing endonuclease